MTDATPLIDAPKKGPGRLIAIIVVVVLVLAAVGIGFAVSRGGSSDETVRIGVVGKSDPYWATFVDAAADEGIDVELVDFGTYEQPNPALTEGEVDLNQFQHIVYLAQYDVAADADLVPIGSTAIYPLPLYSERYTDVSDFEKGDTIAVPDDASNLARSLLVLQSNGLIELKDGGSIFSGVNDIDTDASTVEVTPVAADLAATSLPDFDGSIITNDYATKAGLSPDDIIAQDDPNDPKALPYVNVFAAREADKDDETYAKLVEIYQDTQAVTDGVVENSGGTAVTVKVPVADLESSLSETEELVEQNG
ncbi:MULTISPECIES: MetQ/NlpA family ABC transporter substrate-binding protein [unclassified Frigoribacterium]|uniref:MetQ/NlpA family ABC transporter substrate-binding protein n=1 Tax=unclassified Frigoribacterium TaxID=2627005 RepID=UPI0007020194|nr:MULTISPECIES: MetQ/NlpA family ABC transporter substrate-binding protein [unclassified Frigoribacterium]KQO82678.1 methionine ABC transporter substrate-binding protein [Frigoribacterium sp. Leaf263]KQR64640.1 methionine ABC transporter substrate-binding protein [Frigoribacterium sp. Leaf172]